MLDNIKKISKWGLLVFLLSTQSTSAEAFDVLDDTMTDQSIYTPRTYSTQSPDSLYTKHLDQYQISLDGKGELVVPAELKAAVTSAYDTLHAGKRLDDSHALVKCIMPRALTRVKKETYTIKRQTLDYLCFMTGLQPTLLLDSVDCQSTQEMHKAFVIQFASRVLALHIKLGNPTVTFLDDKYFQQNGVNALGMHSSKENAIYIHRNVDNGPKDELIDHDYNILDLFNENRLFDIYIEELAHQMQHATKSKYTKRKHRKIVEEDFKKKNRYAALYYTKDNIESDAHRYLKYIILSTLLDTKTENLWIDQLHDEQKTYGILCMYMLDIIKNPNNNNFKTLSNKELRTFKKHPKVVFNFFDLREGPNETIRLPGFYRLPFEIDQEVIYRNSIDIVNYLVAHVKINKMDMLKSNYFVELANYTKLISDPQEKQTYIYTLIQKHILDEKRTSCASIPDRLCFLGYFDKSLDTQIHMALHRHFSIEENRIKNQEVFQKKYENKNLHSSFIYQMIAVDIPFLYKYGVFAETDTSIYIQMIKSYLAKKPTIKEDIYSDDSHTVVEKEFFTSIYEKIYYDHEAFHDRITDPKLNLLTPEQIKREKSAYDIYISGEKN